VQSKKHVVDDVQSKTKRYNGSSEGLQISPVNTRFLYFPVSITDMSMENWQIAEYLIAQRFKKNFSSASEAFKRTLFATFFFLEK
jgi:GR25 family glycosyltransferase involved in LPS biosynthesis